MQKAYKNGGPFKTFEEITGTVVRIDDPTPGRYGDDSCVEHDASVFRDSNVFVFNKWRISIRYYNSTKQLFS